MSGRDDGGPAFPYEVRDGDGLPKTDYYGMTLRDYFIAHAPAEPWPGFNPVMPPKPSPPPRDPVGNNGEAANDGVEKALRSWHSDPCWDAAHDYPSFSYWIAGWEKHWNDLREFDESWAFQRRIQWPAYWADQMLEQRKL